ncbi:uncharacterized protein LOC133295006 [Gastrolobium bilobum]|uniref:uncharacterized protein LOC133295006 n=1 Tax=Gastrolobium bilobum TaxID=150636 RepID=UPI002AB005CB|nr:uncharacterized protein LOC133295006 [Gastrolobium bilobum]
MTPDSRMVVNGAAGGTIGKKIAAQTLGLIDFMERNENASMAVQPVQPKRGLLQLGNSDASLAEQKILSQQISSLNAKLDQMQLSTAQVNSVNCEYYKGEHETNKCPTLVGSDALQVNGVWYEPKPLQNFQRNQNNAPGNNFQRRVQGTGLDYKSNQYLQPLPIPQTQPSELERALLQLKKTTNEFMQETISSFKNHEASIRNLETQIGQLSRQLAKRNPGTFPSGTIINPREQCNVITTTREDLEKVEAPTSKNGHTQEGKEKAKEQPTVVQKKQWDFSQALEKMPLYAKFLKETLSKKRKLTEDEPVTLTAECSAIIQKNLPPKLKGPGSFNASVPLIFGRPFLATSGALIDVPKGELIMRVDGEQATFKVEERNKKEVHQQHVESKPKVKMEKLKSKEKHVKTKFKVLENPPPQPLAYDHGRTQYWTRKTGSSMVVLILTSQVIGELVTIWKSFKSGN